MIIRTACALLLAAVSATARAEWREATTAHFIVYGEDSPERLEAAAMNLERYDHLLRLALELPQESATKLKVYLLKNRDEVQRSMGYGVGTGVAGYYQSATRGSIAVGTRLTAGNMDDIDSQSVLFHEYAHHLLLQHSGAFYPWWYSEGFAEYYGTARVVSDTVIEVGLPARHRATTFTFATWLPLEKLLSARTYEDIDRQVWNLYAEGWLLVHYLDNTPERAGQLRRYLAAVNAGVDLATARDQAFGPKAEALNKELRSYSRKNKLDALRVTFDAPVGGAAALRTLRPAEAALLP
jgi:hypothetical protein